MGSTELYFKETVVPYKLEKQSHNTFKLIVDRHGHYYAKNLGQEPVISPATLQEVEAQVSQNEERLSKLTSTIPPRLQKGAQPTEPPSPDAATEDTVADYVMWRGKELYKDGVTFYLSRVRGEKTYEQLEVYPCLNRNEPGFMIMKPGSLRYGGPIFVPAESYENFLTNLAESSFENFGFIQHLDLPLKQISSGQ